jgi:hypothetical protein
MNTCDSLYSKAFLILLLLIVFAIPGVNAQTNFEVSVDLVNRILGGPADNTAMVTVGYDPGEKGSFLSLGAQNMTGTVFNIILSNLYLPPKLYTNNRQYISKEFDQLLLAIPPEVFPSELTIFIHIFKKPTDYPFDPMTFVGSQIVSVGSVTDDAQGAAVGPNPPPGGFGTNKIKETSQGDVLSDVYYYGCDMPNIDLNNSQFSSTETFAGDKNACVPASTTNSLLWLDKKFNLFYGFPPLEHDLLDSLSHYMKRPAGEGTPTNDMIKGKLDYISRHHLPISVKYQVEKDYIDADINSTDGKSTADCQNTGDYPTWEFLKEALKDTCDVEINYVAEKSDGTTYAHSVVVTGVEEYKRSGLLYLDFKHDKNQGQSGGTRQESTQIFVDNDGKLRIASRRNAFIRDVVVECHVAPQTGVREIRSQISSDYMLARNYPNPFNSSTTITFSVRQTRPVTLSVYSTNGSLVQSVNLGQLDPGQHSYKWDAGYAPSGLYLVKISDGVQVGTLKLLLVK